MVRIFVPYVIYQMYTRSSIFLFSFYFYYFGPIYSRPLKLNDDTQSLSTQKKNIPVGCVCRITVLLNIASFLSKPQVIHAGFQTQNKSNSIFLKCDCRTHGHSLIHYVFFRHIFAYAKFLYCLGQQLSGNSFGEKHMLSFRFNRTAATGNSSTEILQYLQWSDLNAYNSNCSVLINVRFRLYRES